MYNEKHQESLPPHVARILVVDDSPVNRKVAECLMQCMGFDVHVAANGREAVDAVQREEYALILMDLQMPEIDGYEATRQIRRLEKPGTRLPIIAWSSWPPDLDAGDHLVAGMDDYLYKPVRLEILRSTVLRWIRRSGLR